MGDYTDLSAKVIKLSRQIVRMCTAAGSGHPSSALSLVHMTTALMYRIMRYDPKNPWQRGADRLVLSGGHAVPVVYAAYCDLGGVVGTVQQPSELSFDDALTLRSADSVLDGHPNPAIGFPFFDAATGSLGQGLSVAGGLACAAKLDQSDRKIFCLIGDGEAREGQISEALDFIIDQDLKCVYPIFNCNGQGQSGYVSPQQSPDRLAAKLEAYGFDVKTIDGHNWDEIFSALTSEPDDKPLAIVAKTIKGWGVKEFQQANYHGKPLKEDMLEQAMADLDEMAAQLAVSDAPDEPAVELTAPGEVPPLAGGDLSAGSFAEALQGVGLADALEAKTLATRRAYGAALAALGDDQRIVVMDGDVKNSTFAEFFANKHPERYFEARIAEQNMISTAVGFAAAGRIPFISSFAKFLIRGYDQLEMAAISDANVKLCGSHAGVSLAADGPSQMGLPDLAFTRCFARSARPDGSPAMRIFHPSDAVSAFRLTELMANLDGLCYMRTHRPDVPFIYEPEEQFALDGYKHLVDGEDLAIVASGYMVGIAQQALEILEREAGLSASLIDAYAIPLAADGILQIGDDCRGQILIVEDNYAGGFAAEIAAAAAKSDLGVMVTSLYVRQIPKSAKTPEEMLRMLNLAATDIAAAAQKMFDQSE